VHLSDLSELADRYTSALRDYLARAEEAALHQAYEIGRKANTLGVGVLDIASLHHNALVDAVLHVQTPEEAASVAGHAANFFLEALSPFEMAQRGFRENTAQMRYLKFALEGANDGIWDVDLITGDVQLSPRGCEMLGYRPEEFRTDIETWNQMVHPDDLPATQAVLEDHLAGRTPLFSIEQRLRTKSGNGSGCWRAAKCPKLTETANPSA